MPEAKQTGIALLTVDPDLRQRLADCLPNFHFSILTADAQLILVDLPPGEIALPPLLPPGVPVVALVPGRTYESVRPLFLAGAADVLDRDAPLSELRETLERQLFEPPVHRPSTRSLAAELFYLREVSQAAAEGAALSWLFERIVAATADILGADIVSLMLLEEEEESEKSLLRIKAARGLSEEIIRLARVEVGRGISGLVAQRGEPLLLPDVEKADLGVVSSNPRYVNKGLLSVPIKVRREIIGVLNVNNKIGGKPFQDEDLALLVTLCAQAGLAIDNARLFEELRRRADELTTLNERLRHFNQAKSELIVNLSHEFKTPLTAIQGYLDLLQSGLVPPDKTNEILARVGNRSRHLNRLTERLLTYFALDSKLAQFYTETFNFLALTADAVELAKATADRKQVRIEVDEMSLTCLAQADKAHYRELLLALLDNAVKFNREGGRIRISGARLVEGDRHLLEVSVADTGEGIAAALQQDIFEDFRQTENIMTAKPDGLGLGLAIARAVTEGHRCGIRLAKSDREGTTISFTVPLAPRPMSRRQPRTGE